MSALIASLRSTSALVSSTAVGLVGIVADGCEQFRECRCNRVAGFLEFAARFGSPVSAKPRAALSARRINSRMSAIFFSTPTV